MHLRFLEKIRVLVRTNFRPVPPPPVLVTLGFLGHTTLNYGYSRSYESGTVVFTAEEGGGHGPVTVVRLKTVAGMDVEWTRVLVRGTWEGCVSPLRGQTQ